MDVMPPTNASYNHMPCTMRPVLFSRLMGCMVTVAAKGRHEAPPAVDGR